MLLLSVCSPVGGTVRLSWSHLPDNGKGFYALPQASSQQHWIDVLPHTSGGTQKRSAHHCGECAADGYEGHPVHLPDANMLLAVQRQRHAYVVADMQIMIAVM